MQCANECRVRSSAGRGDAIIANGWRVIFIVKSYSLRMGDLISSEYAQSVSAAVANAPAAMTAAAISAVSRRIVQYCRRDFIPNRYLELYDAPRSGQLMLRQTPVMALNSVTLMPTSTTPMTFSPDQFDLRPAVGRVIFRPGAMAWFSVENWPFADLPIAGADAIEVDYIAGFGYLISVPGAIAAGVNTINTGSISGLSQGQSWSLQPGELLTVDAGISTQETVAITAVSSTGFTATFAMAHSAGPLLGAMIPLDVQLAAALMVGNVINQADLTKARESQGRTVGYEYVVRPGDLFLTPEVANLLMPYRDALV